MKKLKELKSWVNAYEAIKTATADLQVLYDFFKEGEAEEADVQEAYKQALRQTEDLELRNMLQKEEDKLGALLKINAGAGGTESQDWAEMLMRMYVRWGEQNKYKVSVNHILEGEEAGIKTVTLQFEGDYAYGYLKGENGVHRLVRLSPRSEERRVGKECRSRGAPDH